MKRPTIADLSKESGVSISTVNRVLKDASQVREATRERVMSAAQRIGFYGLGTLQHAIREARPSYSLGILLQQGHRGFYRDLGRALQSAAGNFQDAKIELKLEFLEDLMPEAVAARIIDLGTNCDALALVSSEHPLISTAIDTLAAAGVPAIALIAPLTARTPVGFVGLDNWKVGRTAAWAFEKICRNRGEIGILLGHHRFRNQELNEAGFRSYFREVDAGFTLLEPQSTFESAAVAREITQHLLASHPNLSGLFVSGGGITGALSALREAHLHPDFVCVGYELFEPTRAALIDGIMTMVISHPLKDLATMTIDTLVKSKRAGPDSGAQNQILDFDIAVSQSV